ncbi:DUF72 domain-containing protein [Nonomuraea endophytica]|uniref:Uncharacterized protein YecE (DUF72 family) n=1 Tax=Nonomuraea endophytica TaxID=714136 RepID=A0A7W7ZZH8_9ACTN|nr:DUF72 domain-containing protein [Nonomuraea endophytica]MBB5076680.1 uncharacterized protein YecE (DUF72 family) [Nonomuraea endophytica]
MDLHVGCAMWSHARWGLPQEERLGSYATRCNAVEGNTTFYATPSRTTVETWAAQTPADFRFVIKLPKTITHEGRLGDVGDQVRAFLHAIEPLGSRAHALWVQLPSSFSPSDLGVLATFLRRMPAAYNYAVEVRHRAFFDHAPSIGDLERLLGGLDTEWVPFDTVTLFESPPTSDAERDAWTKKPRVPRRSHALTERPIVRYLGRDDTTKTVEGWHFWVETTAAWLREGRSPTVFIHTPDNAEALTLARRFHDEVRAQLPDLTPLPEPVAEEPPLTLF